MPIIKWQPFNDLDRMFEENWFPQTKSEEYVPAINVSTTEKEVIIETPLAGVRPEDIKISVEDDVLMISGKYKKEEETEKKDYYKKEIREGSFHRSVNLPVEVKPSEASAETKNGMLKIVIPKQEVKPRSEAIEIKVK
ncbi:MAG: Hsp20/alpha crystallin family protein [Patescibacteria group bacterium]|nr:Hsp20/alpha crystallin family protein [Patescibacteria group bacterium]